VEAVMRPFTVSIAATYFLDYCMQQGTVITELAYAPFLRSLAVNQLADDFTWLGSVL